MNASLKVARAVRVLQMHCLASQADDLRYCGRRYCVRCVNEDVISIPPPSSVTFDPQSSQAGQCGKLDSTTVTFTYTAPIPPGLWTIPLQVVEHFTRCSGSSCIADTTSLAQFNIHGQLRILDIDYSNQEIEGGSYLRSIGERVNLAASSPYQYDELSSCAWSIPSPNAAVANYGPFNASSVASPLPLPPLTSNQAQFYWSRPFSRSSLSVTCSVANSSGSGDGGPLAPVSLTATVTAQAVAPSYTITATVGQIQIVNGGIGFGNQVNPPANMGLHASYKLNAQNYGGYFGPNQTDANTTTFSPQPAGPSMSTGGQRFLDGCPIYTHYYNANGQPPGIYQATVAWVGPNKTSAPLTDDAPFQGMEGTQMSESDAFVTTLMFKPNVGPRGSVSSAIWVPLAALTWSYFGSVYQNGSNLSWSATPSPNPTQSPASGTYVYTYPTSAPAAPPFVHPAAFPVWSGVIPSYDGCPNTP